MKKKSDLWLNKKVKLNNLIISRINKYNTTRINIKIKKQCEECRMNKWPQEIILFNWCVGGAKKRGWRIINISSCLNMRRGIVEKFEQGPSVSPTVQFHVLKTRIYSRRIPHVRADNVIAFRSDYNVSVSHSALSRRSGKILISAKEDLFGDKVGVLILMEFVNIAFDCVSYLDI